MKNLGILAFIAFSLAACGGQPPVSQEEPAVVPTAEQTVAVAPVGSEPTQVTMDELRGALENVPAPEGSVEVTSHDGKVVSITREELARAFAAGLRMQRRFFDAMHINGDGSVTIVAPRFLFSGEERVMVATLSPSEQVAKSRLGVCVHFGFARSLVADTVAYNDSLSSTAPPALEWLRRYPNGAALSEAGEVVWSGRMASLSGPAVYTSITCSSR